MIHTHWLYLFVVLAFYLFIYYLHLFTQYIEVVEVLPLRGRRKMNKYSTGWFVGDSLVLTDVAGCDSLSWIWESQYALGEFATVSSKPWYHWQVTSVGLIFHGKMSEELQNWYVRVCISLYFYENSGYCQVRNHRMFVKVSRVFKELLSDLSNIKKYALKSRHFLPRAFTKCTYQFRQLGRHVTTPELLNAFS
jgi:hypothetical protein